MNVQATDTAAISRRFATLSEAGRAELKARLRARRIALSSLPIVSLRGEGDVYPLSVEQERLWFLWQLDPAASAYTMFGAVRLDGALDAARLRAALTSVVQRHESLRTRFVEIEGDGRQKVLQKPEFDWIASDVEEGGLIDAVSAIVTKPFDLLAEPVLRAGFLRLSDEAHVLVLAMHHIVSDGWSIDILLREMSAFYEGAGAGLPTLPMQYADYALWQRALHDDAWLDEQLGYWRDLLGGDTAPLRLPIDRPRGQVRGTGGGRVTARVPEATLDALRRLAQDSGTTLFVVLLSAWQALLHRYAGMAGEDAAQGEIRVGVPFAGRERPELRDTIGFFLNTLVLKAEIGVATRFADLVAQQTRRMVEARAHADVPFAQIVDALGIERNLADTPIFQTIFNLRTGLSKRPRHLGAAAMSELPGAPVFSQYDLALDAFERGDALTLSLTYSDDVFQPATGERLLDTYLALLDRVAADAGLRIGAIVLDSRATPQPPVRHPYIPVTTRLRETAARTPAAPCLTCGDEHIDHAALDAWSDAIAARLQASGVRCDEPVGLCVERSVAMVAALVGILKAGGAYLPLDPDYPADRLRHMVRDAGLTRVVADAATARRLSDILDGTEIVPPVRDGGVPARLEPHPDQLASIVYTSGSTGTPKGGGVSHGALSLHLDDFIPAFGYTAADVALQFSTIGFDAAVEQMLPLIAVGGHAVLRGPNAWTPADLTRCIVDHKLTIADVPTSFWQEWMSDLPRAAHLRRVTVGGEALAGDQVARWRRGPLGAVRLDNRYGPTETTMSALYRRTEAADESSVVVSIGVPYPGRSARVLDHAGDVVPAGGYGELCIGGDSLARGYVGRPGLTAERFVPDPEGAPGSRLYRTGDLCRPMADGTVAFLGRLDRQVKLRGLRIELGEIEAALRAQPGVGDAVVELRGRSEAARLVGYIVGAAAPDAALAEALATRLPAHMIPSVFVRLEAFPSTPAGKLDRAALPEPEVRPQGPRRAPGTEPEAILCRIAGDILGIPAPGPDDNFFRIGGDSILSLRLVARARDAGLLLTPRQIFESPVLARLAEVARPVEVVAEPEAVEGPIPLTPIQSAFFRRHPDGENHWNQSVLLRVAADCSEFEVKNALGALIDTHEALRLRFAWGDDGTWVAQAGPAAGASCFEAIDLRGQRGTVADVAPAIQAGLDIKKGPLLRAALIRLESGEARLLLVIHHLVVDGVSWRILLDDLRRALEGHALGARPRWSRWARGLAAYRASLADDSDWWRRALQPAVAWPAPACGLRRDARKVSWRLDAAATDALLHRTSHAWRTSVEDLLVTALATAVARLSGGGGALLLMEGHGREDVVPGADLSTTVGWFTTQYPAWLPASGATAAARIVAVKDALRAIPQRGLHWGLLPAEVRDELPQPRVGFNYLGQFGEGGSGTAVFALAKEEHGPSLAPEAPLDLALDINGAVVDGTLQVSFVHDPQAIAADALDRLVADFDAELRAIIAACTAAPPGATASDFPLAGLSSDALARSFPSLEGLDDLYAATSVQAGMLYHGLRAPGSGLYVGQLRLRLGPGLDVEVLQRAFHHLMARHAILRTSFELRGDGGVLQVVHTKVAWRLAVVADVPADAAAHDTFLDEWCDADRARGFDLAQAPLVRVGVLARPDGGYDLVWTSHHALLDGWSQSRLLGELSLAYAALRAGGVPTLGPVRPYRDYIAWLGRRDEAASEAWWRAMFAGDEPALLLASLGDAGAADGPGSDCQVRETLAETTSTALRASARRHGLTMGTLLQGAWALLLSRWGGRRRVAFGVTVSGRPAELEGVDAMLGLFINSLPFWVEVRGEDGLWSFLAGLQAQAGGLREHEHTPLPSLQRWSGRSGEALFDSLLVFENYPVDAAAKGVAGDLAPRGAAVLERTHYPLTLMIDDGEAGLSLRWLWDGGRLGATTVDALRRDYTAVLGWLASAVEVHVGELVLPRAAEADTPPIEPTAAFVDVLTRIAACDRSATALVCGSDHLDYSTLLSRAWGLSQWLGHAPEERIGLCASRSNALVWGLLGIMGAGAAYVPLDPAYPRARLAHALKDAGITRVLADDAGAAALDQLTEGCELIRLEDVREAGAPPSWPAPHPEQLAYVIYTSGSTGVPKGVGVSHGALVRLLDAMDGLVPIKPSDRWLAVTSMSFDIAALELFLPLIKGAQVIVAREAEVLDGAALAALLTRSLASVMQATPSGWKLLLAAGWRAKDAPASGWPKLRGLSGGEALPRDLAQTLAARGVDLWNVYGPTETTIWSSGAAMTPDLLDGVAQARLGAPLAGEHLTLLGEDGLAVPAGGTGELCIGGVGLARGYFGRPALTAERFVPDPDGAPGGRLYRTGDLARADAHGLAYLGRLDTQVKLRGHRIELGEIEAALRVVPGVRDAAVKLHGGGTRLVGYVTGDADPEVARKHLGERLPAIMVPQAIVVLDALPLTPNGKLDRNRLEEPELSPDKGEAPANAIERAVCAAAAEALRLPTIGVDADFFRAGGDSISAMRLVAILASAIGREVALAKLFAAPVLRDFAARIGAAERSVVRPRDRADAGPYPLSLEQERLWVLWRLDPTSPAYTMFSAVRLDGALDPVRMRSALVAVVRRHESLRTRFVEIAGEGRQEVLEAPDFDWIEREVGEDQARAAVSSVVTVPFDLLAGPVLRAGLLRLSDASHILVLAMHHIVSDGWSIDILRRELSAFYDGSGDTLPPVPLQAADYALWQRASHDRHWRATQLHYWRDLLGSRSEPLRLPTDRQRGRVRGTDGGRVVAPVPEVTVAALRKLAQGSGTTLFVVLLSAWQALLHRYAGFVGEDAAQGEIRVGVPFAGRERPELRDTIGFFLNTLVLKAEIGVDTGFADLVEQQTLRMAEARAHADVPFAQIVDALGIERSVADTPVFQTIFNLERAAEIAVPKGLAAGSLDAPITTARYELALNLTETGESLRAALGFASDVFTAATARTLLDGWLAMLEQVAADPGVRIGAIGLDARGARDVAAVAAFVPVVDRVAAAAAVAGRPNTIALSCEGRHLTRAEFQARVDAIAADLQEAGIGIEARVGLCLMRGPDLVAAMLGIMKAGGAFVPLDPDHPPARLRDIAQDAGLTLVLADAETAALARGLADVPVLTIDDAASGRPIERPIDPAQLAYVLYTSGTTGRPKGIGVSHRALSLHLDDFITTHAIADRDVVLNSSTLGFDVALHEILPALIQGGRVVMRGRAPWLLESLTVTLVTQNVTFARIPTALWQQWIRTPLPPLPALRQITVGGEGLPGDALAHWFDSRLAAVALDNLYGPTETTVAALHHRVTRDDAGSAVVSIGQPYPGRSARVLDQAGDLVPAGGYGELCIGGESLARGYVGRPGLTAERFVPDPDGTPGSRLYRTGDLCRPTADGAVTFLGRLDRQVKLRGLRIELGEIEAALRAQPGVADAAVELRGRAETARLVGYIVGEADDATLTEALAARLPAHMIPSAFVYLDALPATPTGKLNRAALPEPTTTKPVPRCAPTSEAEAMLCRIVGEVLAIPEPGPDDAFFRIGGDSLSALRLVAACAERGLPHIGLTDVFASPTLAALAAPADLPAYVKLLNARAPTKAFGFHPSFGLTAEYIPLAKALERRVTLYGLDSPFLGGDPPALPDFAALAADHVARMRRLQPRGPYHLLGWSLGGWLAIEAACQLIAAGETVASLALIDTLALAAPDANLDAEIVLDDEATLAAVRDAGGAYLVPDSIRSGETAQLRRVIGAFRHHNRLLRGYRLPQVDAPVSVWWSSETVARWPDLLDWSRLANRVSDAVVVEGTTHLDVVRDARVIAEVGEVIFKASRT